MGITCYRLYEQDVPEVPLVVDRYEDYLHIAEFSRPTDHTPAEHADWLDLMQRTAAEVLELPLDHVFLKKRERQRGAAQYERLGSEQHLLVAHEGGLQFEVVFPTTSTPASFSTTASPAAWSATWPPASGS